MNRAFNNVALEIRQRLYADEFRCLESFLFSVADHCSADEAGVVSIIGEELELWRSAGKIQSFNLVESILQSELQPRHDPRWKQNYSRCVWIESLEKNLVLRRIWPATAWQHQPNELFWLYIFNPKAVIPPKHAAMDDLVASFGGLASGYIRWMNELFVLHDELLSPPQDDPRQVVKEFQKLVVRPVLPVHFHSIVSRFSPKDPNPFKWARHIEDLKIACIKPAICRCHYDDAEEATRKQFFTCPQTPAIDRVLIILARLELWRTGFWRAEPQDEKEKCKKTNLLAEGLEGLRDAVEALRWQDVERKEIIDFGQGAVGLAGERLLLRHFCADAIAQALKEHGDMWKSARVHPLELECADKLANLASTLLGDGRWTPDAIQNLLQVVALFGHSVLNVPARVDLARHLQQTLRGETALHTLKSRYRDHFFHTLEVCFLGYAIITSHPDGTKDQTFGGWLLEQSKAYRTTLTDQSNLPHLPKDEQELLAQWWVAALIHDTAYGIDIFGGTLKLLDFFTNRKEIDDFIGKARGTVKDMAEKLAEIAPELKGDDSLKKGDHGVIAAASLSEILKKIGVKTAEKFNAAVRAIAFHNTRHPAIDAGVDPVAALLILCDTVQEWGRSSLGFDRSPSVLLSRMMEAASTPKEEQFGPVKRYVLSLKPISLAQPGTYAWQKAKDFVIELDFGPEQMKECKAIFTWADMTYNLQRVNFASWNINLQLLVSAPIPQAGKSQFELFGGFVHKQQVRFLEEWFRTADKGDPSTAVYHRVACRNPSTQLWEDVDNKAEGARDIITFNLQELGKVFSEERPLMGGNAGNFDNSIKAWSDYAREQADAPPLHGRPI